MKTPTKNLLALFILTIGLSYNAYCISYVSAGAGPADWGVAASWTPVGIPGTADDVTISAGHTIQITALQNCNNLTVDGTLQWLANVSVIMKGNYILTGSESGLGTLQFNSPGTTITTTGTTSASVYYSVNNNRTVSATSTVNKTSTTTKIGAGVTLINLGTYRMGASATSAGSVFTNGANAILILKFSGFMTGRVFNASAAGNLVRTLYNTGTIPVAALGYYDLNLAGTATGTKTLLANTTVINNLTINATNTLNSNNFDFTVGGNWTNSGIFTASAGKTVTFNGTAAQSVSNTTGTTTFKGLTINNTAGVTLTTGTYNLDEVLTVSNGTFNTGGRPFTMTSTAAATARIAPIAGTGAIAGNFTIQRFITARDTTFADFSSPVQSSTFADWAAELPAISYNSSPPAQEASAATYDENADVYVPITSSGTSLNAGQGYEIFLAGDFAYAPLPNTTMTTIGVPNQGDFDLSSTVSNNVQGWNLVGNPFASSVSWSSIYTASGAGASGMYDYVEMYDYTIEDWNGYTSADAIEMGSTQGFWIYGSPEGGGGPITLIIPESAKTTSSNSSIKSAIKQSYFTLKMSSTFSPNAHVFKVAASATSSDGLELNDIPFRASLNKATPEMYCMIDGRKININNFNSSNNNYSITLKTKVALSGKYKIEPSGFDFIPDYTCVTLQDNLTGTIVDLKDGNGYCFTMNANDNPDRFILHFSKDGNCKTVTAASVAPSTDFANQVEILPTQNGNVLNFNLSETTSTSVSVVNVLGQTIVEAISLEANNQSININLPEGYSGLYIIKVESAKGSITKKFIKK